MCSYRFEFCHWTSRRRSQQQWKHLDWQVSVLHQILPGRTNSFVIQSNNDKENLCSSSANTPDMNMFLSPPQQSSDLQVKKDTDTHHHALSKWLFRVGEKDDKAVTIQVSLELNINISYWFPFCPDTEKRTISQQKTVLFNLLFTPRLLSLFILLYRLLLPRLEIMT